MTPLKPNPYSSPPGSLGMISKKSALPNKMPQVAQTTGSDRRNFSAKVESGAKTSKTSSYYQRVFGGLGRACSTVKAKMLSWIIKGPSVESDAALPCTFSAKVGQGAEVGQMPAKTATYAERFFGWCGQIKSDTATWGISFLFKQGLDITMLKSSSLQAVAEMKKLCGNKELEVFSEIIFDFVIDKADTFVENEGYLPKGHEKELQKEKECFHELIKCLVNNATLNIAKKVKYQGNEVNLVNMITCVANVFREKIASVEDKVQAAQEKVRQSQQKVSDLSDTIPLTLDIRGKQDQQEMVKRLQGHLRRCQSELARDQAALNHELLPVVEGLLGVAFPRGAEDLPLMAPLKTGGFVRKAVWSLLRGKLLEKTAPHMITAYREYLIPQKAMDSYRATLHQILGTEASEKTRSTAEMVESLCGILAQKITLVAEEEGNNYIFELTEQRPQWFKNFQIDAYAQQVVKSLLMQAAVHYLQGLQQEGLPLQQARISQLFEKIAVMGSQHLDTHAEELDKAAKNHNKGEREAKLCELFAPLSAELMDLFRSPHKTGNTGFPVAIPFPTFLEEHWEYVRDVIVPKAFGKMYLDTTSWMREMDATAEEIKERTINQKVLTSHLPEACRLLGQQVADLIPSLVCREGERDEIAEALHNGVKEHLRESGAPKEMTVERYLDEHGVEIKKQTVELFLSFFAPSDVAAPVPYQKLPMATYMQGAFLKICNGLTKRVAEKQEKKEFVAQLTKDLLVQIQKHFSVLNQTAKEQGVPSLTNSLHTKYVSAFEEKVEPEDRLHKGVPKSPKRYQERIHAEQALRRERKRWMVLNLTEKIEQCQKNIANAEATIAKAQGENDVSKVKSASKVLVKESHRLAALNAAVLKNKAKIEHCEEIIANEKLKLAAVKKEENDYREKEYFGDFTKTFLEICEVKKDDLPLPGMLKDKLWAQLKDKLLPTALRSLFGLLLDPLTRDKMMVAALKQLNENLSSDRPPQTLDPIKDKAQADLDNALGLLIKEFVQSIGTSRYVDPLSVVKAVFRIDRITDASAELLGQIVRKELGESLLDKMDEWVAAGIENLHPGKWEGVGKDAKYTTPSDELKFTYAMKQDALELAERNKILEAERVNKEYRKELVKTGRIAATLTVEYILKYPFMKFLDIWDRAVDFVFRGYSKRVRKYFSFLGTKLVFRLIEQALEFASRPIRNAFWYFMELYLERKIKHVPEITRLDIHENLLYELLDVLFTYLSSVEKVPDVTLTDEQREKIERHNQEERERTVKTLRGLEKVLARQRKKVAEATPPPAQ